MPDNSDAVSRHFLPIPDRQYVPIECADKYKGKFDKLQEVIFARRKQLVVVPADTELPMAPSGNETFDVGKVFGLPGLRPPGKRVQRRGELGADQSGKEDHSISPEERSRSTIARQ